MKALALAIVAALFVGWLTTEMMSQIAYIQVNGVESPY